MAEIEDLTRRAVDLIWNVYPGYSRDLLALDELTPSVRGNVDLALRVLHRGRAPEHDDLTAARNLGSRRAAQGVPLESVIQAYRSTERTVLLHLLGGSDVGGGGAIESRADLVIRTFDRLTDEMINAYRETSSTIEAARRQVEAELVAAVAGAGSMTVSDVQRWRDVLSIDPSRPWVALCLQAMSDADEVVMQRARRRLAVVLRDHVHGPVLFGNLGRDVIAVLSPRDGTAPLVTAVRRFLSEAAEGVWGSAGFGDAGPSLQKAALSCQQARECARVARSSGSAVLVYEDTLLEALLIARPDVAQRLVETCLGPLGGRPQLIETVEALHAARSSQSAAARALFVHVNTVGNRVHRIEELTGKNPLDPRASEEFAMALLATRLSGGSPAPVG